MFVYTRAGALPSFAVCVCSRTLQLCGIAEFETIGGAPVGIRPYQCSVPATLVRKQKKNPVTMLISLLTAEQGIESDGI